jgi:predicted Zn-dependent protease
MDVAKLVRRAASAATLMVLPLMALPMSATAQVCDMPNCVRDAEIESILREYMTPIFEVAGLKPSEVYLELIQDPTLNAFVANGQRIHVNTGIIMEIDKPETLKGILAHETGHITLGHATTRAGAASAANGVSLISMGLGVLAMAAGHPDAGVALLGSAPEFGALTFFKYTRVEESAADQAALNYLDMTHQSPAGFVDFFEKFRYEELMSVVKQDPYFQAHPISSERIQQVRPRAIQIEARSQPQSARAIHQLAIMKAKLIGYIGPPNRVYNKYPMTDMSEPAQYARAFAAYRATDIKNATTKTQKLIDDHPDNPYYYELMGQILFESAKVEESIAPHRKSVELAPDQPLLKINLARSLIESKNMDNVKEGELVLRDSLDQEKTNPFAWNQLANAYAKEGKIPEADLATAEEAYWLGNLGRAQVFARRAAQKLDPATPNGRRAQDIATMTDPKLQARQGR